MKKAIPVFFILAVAIIANSCRQDKYIPNVCFQENILPIFISKCGSPGCHNSSSGSKHERRSLTNYEEIMRGITPYHPLRSEIFTKIRGNNPEMPPRGSPKLTKKEVDWIKYWINFGAVNSSCGSTTCDTTSYMTYNTNIKPILDVWCTGCHFANSSSNYKLDSYDGAKNAVNSGRFVGAIKHLAGFRAMPDGGGSLSVCEIAQIDKWIAEGMPQ